MKTQCTESATLMEALSITDPLTLALRDGQETVEW
jgi:hypothetical protein